MHFAEFEGRFVVFKEFNTILSPNTVIAHTSHVFLRSYQNITSEFVVVSME